MPGASFRQYRLLEQIGVGGQGVVWSALDKSRKRIYAIKFNEIPDSDQAKAEDFRVEHQLERLVKLHHAHILPFHEYGLEDGLRFTVCPYIPGGTLHEKIKAGTLSFDEIFRYGTEIASALDYLHKQGIIHRDLKSSNILLNLSHNSYLADFGLARVISTSTLAFHTGHGTPPYSPPEQIQSKAITPKSDVFSFGILLFEMFTGQLPWNGGRQLGMEQLTSKQELPDPRELNDDLPPLISDVLRRVTSADPELRPRSAGEVMKMIYYIFNIPSESLPDESDEMVVRNKDAEELLKRGLARWESTNGTFNLGLTRFALIDLEPKKVNTDTYNRFMLSQALTYGYNDDQWWSNVTNPRERLSISLALLRKENEVITARILGHLTGDLDIRAFPDGLPEGMTKSLLVIGIKANDVLLRQQIFAGIRTLVRPESKWNDSLLDLYQIKRLGDLALEDSEFGDAAAELIGHLRSPSAVQIVLNHFDKGRKISALLLIQQVAGSLPSFVQGGVRFRLSMEWITQRLTQQPVNLISAYVMAFLGAAFGVGIQVYLTYQLPNFFDIARITTSLEQGLIIGTVLGLGIFLTRLITERFPESSVPLRVILGTIAGGVVMNIALFVFNVLFLDTHPMGFLITVGCAMIALTFTAGGLIRSRLIKTLFSSVSIFTAITGTWWIHINFATSPVELTPLFRYDYAWSLAQVSFVALSVALLTGIFGNLTSLAIKDE